jgi:Transposase IS116/IS110/IS902 family
MAGLASKTSAMVAAIGNGDAFSKGRDFAAWLGLVPKQISTGDRTCSLSLAPSPASIAGGAGVRPDHPINGSRLNYRQLVILNRGSRIPRWPDLI